MRGREWDREFQLELLKAQLKHERLVVLYSAGISTGVSFIVMALPLGVLLLSEGVTAGIWWLVVWAYLVVGAILSFGFMMLLGYLRWSEQKDTERIRKKYVE